MIDEEIRRLERDSAAGDAVALQKLKAARLRLPPLVVALDLGNSMGFAVSGFGGAVQSGVLDLSIRLNEHPGSRWPRVRDELRKLMFGRTHVAYEAIINHGGGFSKSTLYGLEVQVVEIAAELGVEPMTVAPTTLKKFASGSGRATKEDLRVIGRQRWPGVTFSTHDEIDARFILEWALAQLRPQSGPTKRPKGNK